jgi:hypothetical protein
MATGGMDEIEVETPPSNTFTAVNEENPQSHPAETHIEDPPAPHTPRSHPPERFSTPGSPEDQSAYNAGEDLQLREDPILLTTLEKALTNKTDLTEGEERALRVVKVTAPSTKTTRAFREMPAVRTSVELQPVRAGVARKENITRTVNLEACLGYIVGEIAEPACNYCIEGFGAFGECVVVRDSEGEPYLHGSCMGCHHSSEGTRCSLRGK